jgi:hypothetical protein
VQPDRDNEGPCALARKDGCAQNILRNATHGPAFCQRSILSKHRRRHQLPDRKTERKGRPPVVVEFLQQRSFIVAAVRSVLAREILDVTHENPPAIAGHFHMLLDRPTNERASERRGALPTLRAAPLLGRHR